MNEIETNKLCRLFGHSWRYKDYSNCTKANGDKFDFTASRICIRCKQRAYFYSAWQNEKTPRLAFESDYNLSKESTVTD